MTAMTVTESQKPVQKAFAENADDLLFPAAGQSHEDWTKSVSRALGIPLDIFYLDQLPHADHARAGAKLTQEHAMERGQWLERASRLIMRLSARSWNRIGAKTDAAIIALYRDIRHNDAHSGALPLRLAGYEKPDLACVLLPDRHKNPHDELYDSSGAAQILPILRHVMDQGQFEGLAKRNAELVIDAADYFCPSLLAGPLPSTQPRDPLDPITQSWTGKADKKWKW